MKIWSKYGQKSVKNESKNVLQIGQKWSKMGQKLVKIWSKIGQKMVKNRLIIWLASYFLHFLQFQNLTDIQLTKTESN